jgi:capsular polysaccharide export protein
MRLSKSPLERDLRPIRALVGIAGWKRRAMADFFGAEVRFFSEAAAAVAHAERSGGAVGVWATREPGDLAPLAAKAGVDVARIEDGFIRSVGLGADLIPGASIVVDRRGIYYDPAQPSDLEILLETARFDRVLCARAAALRAVIVRTGLTKYNLALSVTLQRKDPDRRWILVPGQVEDDLSVRHGGGDVRGNLDLLARVRADNPDAHIIYKPHPDVEAGHRTGRVSRQDALLHADAYVANASIPALFEVVDQVCTLTSLAGFEALLRGLPVTTYGLPFYAGWGLTTDLGPACPRRRRRLDLDELTAGVLILYPLYLDPQSGRRCEPEVLADRLAARQFWRAGPLVGARRVQGAAVKTLRRIGVDLRRAR